MCLCRPPLRLAGDAARRSCGRHVYLAGDHAIRVQADGLPWPGWARGGGGSRENADAAELLGPPRKLG
jgi:hypothetical protein